MIHGAFCHGLPPLGVTSRRDWSIKGNVQPKKTHGTNDRSIGMCPNQEKQRNPKLKSDWRLCLQLKEDNLHGIQLTDCLTEQGAPGSLHHRSGLGELQPKEALTMEGSPTQECCEDL